MAPLDKINIIIVSKQILEISILFYIIREVNIDLESSIQLHKQFFVVNEIDFLVNKFKKLYE
jgi:hypothetical protein